MAERYDLLIRKANGRTRIVEAWPDKGEGYRGSLKPGEKIVATRPHYELLGFGYSHHTRIIEPGDRE